MRLLIVRHGDPDYDRDCLTERGRREAELLSEDLAKERIDYAYGSPLGRARETAEIALRPLGMEAEIRPWLREFDPKIRRPDREGLSIAWDWLPQDWKGRDVFLSVDTWLGDPVMAESDAPERWREVCAGIDALLDQHGYRREGRIYRARRPNRETVALFCHFGVESVILSRILDISPMLLWHGTCAQTSSVTTVYTEERREGIASFRVSEYGSIAHLRRAGVEPSFSARFCERYIDEDERHD